MKDNKGFTLVELLVTIALIGTISVIVGVSVNNLLTNQRHRQYDDFVNEMERAGCVYAEDEARMLEVVDNKITNANLIKYGLIKKTMDNPITKLKAMDDDESYVEVTIVNNERICKFVDMKCNDGYCKNGE